jgi:copper resistance protein C
MQVKHHVFAVATTILLMGAAAGTAWAHAELKQATPAVDGTVQAAPTEVTLKFSERLEPAFTAVITQCSRQAGR